MTYIKASTFFRIYKRKDIGCEWIYYNGYSYKKFICQISYV